MTNQLSFTTTGSWDLAEGFGCASLGLAGVCGNETACVVTDERQLESTVLTGGYAEILSQVSAVQAETSVLAAIVVFGNAGGENTFLARLQQVLCCPIVGGGAAIDGASGRKGMIPGGGEAALLLITDQRYTYETQSKCIHHQVLGTCRLTLADPRTILTIDGENALTFWNRKRQELGLSMADFEHLTLSDMRNVNAHLSLADGQLKSGRDLCPEMILRHIPHEEVYEAIRSFYDDPEAVVFGCAGLSGILDRPLDTKSLGLFLFGEVCMSEGYAEFGNLMLSKLIIRKK